MKSTIGPPGPASDAPPTLSERLERGNLMEGCPSRAVLKHVTSQWGVLVLIALQSGTHRFGELRRRISGVSERMLTQTLQWLEGDGLIERKAFRIVPPHVEYTLTPLGLEAAEKVRELADWVETRFPQILRHWSLTRDGTDLRPDAEPEAGR